MAFGAAIPDIVDYMDCMDRIKQSGLGSIGPSFARRCIGQIFYREKMKVLGAYKDEL